MSMQERELIAKLEEFEGNEGNVQEFLDYVLENRLQLLEGLIRNSEGALQKLSE